MNHKQIEDKFWGKPCNDTGTAVEATLDANKVRRITQRKLSNCLRRAMRKSKFNGRNIGL